MDWFRSWHGAPTDNKWLVIAKRANVAPGMVSAVAWALLDHASQSNDRGSVEGFDVETYAMFTGWDESQIEAVIDAMQSKGVITEDGRLAAWEKRQPKKEDPTAADRQKKYRDAKRNAIVTRDNDDTDDVTPSNDLSRGVTQSNDRTEEIRTEEIRTDQERATGLPEDLIDTLKTQYENILGAMPTSIFPDARTYMLRLSERSASDWWLLALKETVAKADRPGWHYMKAVLESWLAAGSPSTGYTNGSGATASKPNQLDSSKGRENSRRISEAVAALALAGVTPEDDRMFYPKLNEWIEAHYGAS